MKRIASLLTACFVMLLLGSPVSLAQFVTYEEEQEIKAVLNQLEDAMRDGDAAEIMGLMSSDASSELKEAIVVATDRRNITFQEEISSVQKDASGNVEVQGTFSAEASNWSINGLSNEFIFTEEGGEWKILETNFHEKFDFSGILGFIFQIISLIFIPLMVATIFWLWMLIDAIVRPIPNKVIWVIVIFLLSTLGAIIYFFAARRSHKKQLQQETGKGTSVVEMVALLLLVVTFFGSIAWGAHGIWGMVKNSGVLTPYKEGTPFAEMMETIEADERTVGTAVSEETEVSQYLEQVEKMRDRNPVTYSDADVEFEIVVSAYADISQNADTEYVTLYFSTEDPAFEEFIGNVLGMNPLSEYDLRIGCVDNQRIFYRNISDVYAAPIDMFRLSSELSENIMQSTKEQPIALRLTRLKDSDSPSYIECSSPFTHIEAAEMSEVVTKTSEEPEAADEPSEQEEPETTAEEEVEERNVVMVMADGANMRGDYIYLDEDTNVWIEYKSGEKKQLTQNAGTTKGCGSKILYYKDPLSLSDNSQFALLPLYCEGDPTEIWVKEIPTGRSAFITYAEKAQFFSVNDVEKILANGEYFFNIMDKDTHYYSPENGISIHFEDGYDANSSNVQFGDKADLEKLQSGADRPYLLEFIEPRSLDAAMQAAKDDDLINNPVTLKFDNAEVLQYEAYGLCSHVVMEVVGKKHNYKLSSSCEGDFEYLDKVVSTIQFIK